MTSIMFGVCRRNLHLALYIENAGIGKVNMWEGKRVYKALLPFFEKMLKNIDI